MCGPWLFSYIIYPNNSEGLVSVFPLTDSRLWSAQTVLGFSFFLFESGSYFPADTLPPQKHTQIACVFAKSNYRFSYLMWEKLTFVAGEMWFGTVILTKWVGGSNVLPEPGFLSPHGAARRVGSFLYLFSEEKSSGSLLWPVRRNANLTDRWVETLTFMFFPELCPKKPDSVIRGIWILNDVTWNP